MMRRVTIALLPLLLVGLLLPLLVGGCKSGGQSAQAVADTYVGLMKNEKYDEAAKLWEGGSGSCGFKSQTRRGEGPEPEAVERVLPCWHESDAGARERRERHGAT